MRIQTLRLARFGAFDDMDLEFSKAPGVHLVYGPNGAGKSTTLDALRSVLFGIRPGERAFKFESASLRLGARLVRDGGEELSFLRRTSTKSPLWNDTDDEPIDEERLLPFLGNFSRDQFETLFGLDLETMVAGGEELLDGGGEIGRALFGAGLGGKRLSAVTARLTEDVRSLWVPGSSKARINKLLAEHRTLLAEQSRAVLSTSAFDKDRRELATLRAESEKRAAERRVARAAADALGRLARALGALEPLDAKREERAKLGVPRPLDADRTARARDAFNDDAALERAGAERAARRAELSNERLRLRSEARADLIESTETVEALRQRLGSFRDAAAATDGARARLDEARAERDRALRRAGAAAEIAAKSESSAAGTSEELEEAVGDHVERLQRAADEVERCTKELKRAEALVAVARERADADLSDGFASELSKLAPFDGGLEELAALRPPSEGAVQAASEELSKSSEAIEANERERAAREAAETEARAGLDALRSDPSGVPPTVDELGAARARRDELLRDALRGAVETSEALAAVQRADGLGDRLRDQSARVAERARLELALERAREEKRVLGEEWERLVASAEDARRRWRAAWESCPFEPDGPDHMARWLDRRSTLLARVAEAQEVTAQEARKAEEARALRVSELEAARETEAARQDEWRAWAESQRIDPSVGAVAARKRVRSLVDVRAAEDAVARAEAEVRDLEETVGRFAGDVARAAESVQVRVDEETLGAALARADADVALAEARMATLSSAVEEAKRAESQLGDTERRIEVETKSEENAEARRAEIERELGGIAEHAGIRVQESDWRAELKALAQASDRARELDAEIARLDASFQENARGRSPEDVRSEVGERTVRDLDEEGERALERASVLDDELGDLAGRIGALAARVEGEGSDEAARIEARIAEVEAELESAAETYVEARIAQSMLDREVERYRAEAQGPLLARAQELFEILTLGAYERLHPSEHKGKEVMVARRPDGTTVHTDGMSTGTRDQLYLALRIASVEHMLEVSEPMPFIADDLFVNFDDERTEAALRVLAKLSESTQVIVFSHHESVVDTAVRLGDEGVGVEVVRLRDEAAREASAKGPAGAQ